MDVKKFLMALSLCAAVLFLNSCGEAEGLLGNKIYKIYYLDAKRTELVPVETECSSGTGDMVGIITELLAKLHTDGGGDSICAIPRDVEVNDFQMKENQLAIYFTAAYNNQSGIDEILSRAAVVKTLCQVEGIDYVEFYVEDQPLMVDGAAVGLMSSDAFVLDIDDMPEQNSKQITLYFADEHGEKLRTLSAKIMFSAAQPLPQMLMQTLIGGPEAVPGADVSHIVQTIPPGTVLNSIAVRDNVCYVDLGRAFTEMLPDVTSDVVVYSIVNTLCELSNVNRVQFSVDGEPMEKYGDTMNFYLPFERNLDLLMGDAIGAAAG